MTNGYIFTQEAVRMLAKYNNEYNLIDNELLYLIQQELNGGVSEQQDDFLNEAVRNYSDDGQMGGKKKSKKSSKKKSSKKSSKKSKKSKKGGAKKKKSSKKSKKSTKKSTK